MAEITIQESDFASLKGKTVVITGGGSGIGLATTQLLLKTGANVVVGDFNAPPIDPAPKELTFAKTNVTQWPSLLNLFKTAESTYGSIDHVFANAGIGPKTNYFASNYDSNGELLEPKSPTLEVNLGGLLNTTYLAMHHFRNQTTGSEASKHFSIVLTASASSFQPFTPVDYTISKHAALGLMRSAVVNLERQKAPVRVNAVGPSWTQSGIITEDTIRAVEKIGGQVQSGEAVAKNVALLMADESRNGQFFYVAGGRYIEVEESTLRPAAVKIVGEDEMLDAGAVSVATQRALAEGAAAAAAGKAA